MPPPSHEVLEPLIFTIRGHRVMLDADLARIIWGGYEGLEPGGKAEFKPIPGGFCISNGVGGRAELEGKSRGLELEIQ